MKNVRFLDGSGGDIWIEHGRIAVSPNGGSEPQRVFDGGGGLCVTPFVDAHLHLDKVDTARSGAAPPASIEASVAAMRDAKVTAVTAPGGLRSRMEAALEGAIDAGTRLVRAVVDVDELWGLTGFFAARSLQHSMAPRIDLQIVAFAQEGLTPRVVALLEEAARSGAAAIGGHTEVDPDARQHLARVAQIARDRGLPLEVHVDETPSVESSHLDDVLDLAGDLPLTLVHCLSLAVADPATRHRMIERVREHDAAVVVAPGILRFGLPLAPVDDLLAADVRVLVGSDNLRDLFVPLGTGRVLDLVRLAALVGGVSDDTRLARLLDGATAGGQTALGAPLGLAEGAPASFLVLEGQDARAVINGADGVRLQFDPGVVVPQP